MIRSREIRCRYAGRNAARFVYDATSGHVYVEVTGNHDGTSVSTSVQMDRAQFAEMVKDLGAL